MPRPQLTSNDLSWVRSDLIRRVLGIEMILGRQMSLNIQTEQTKRFMKNFYCARKVGIIEIRVRRISCPDFVRSDVLSLAPCFVQRRFNGSFLLSCLHVYSRLLVHHSNSKQSWDSSLIMLNKLLCCISIAVNFAALALLDWKTLLIQEEYGVE